MQITAWNRITSLSFPWEPSNFLGWYLLCAFFYFEFVQFGIWSVISAVRTVCRVQKMVSVNEESNYIEDQTRPFTLRLNICTVRSMKIFANWKPFRNNKIMLFIATQKLFSSSRYLNFCLNFLVIKENGLVRKIRPVLNFVTSQSG